ncbi:MAG: tetratricopeptide repeat protein [Verrucomicrobiales bacterium]|nr:tetratricopeptide repeat protein [Verrucomicrobiales bacterium]
MRMDTIASMQGRYIDRKYSRVVLGAVLAAFVLLAELGLQAQQDLRGAEKVIAEVVKVLEKPEKHKGEKEHEEAGSMKEKIKTLQETWNAYFDKRIDLAEQASVSEWLLVFDLYTEASLKAKRMDWSVWKREPGRRYAILGEVPDSAAWESWLAALQKRSEGVKADAPERAAYLAFLVNFLKGNRELAWKSWQGFSKMMRAKETTQEDYQARQMLETLDRLEAGVAKVLKIEGYGLKEFELALKKRESISEEEASYGGQSLSVPKLAKLTTKDKASALLKRVFAIEFEEYQLNFESDEETSQLAVAVLIANPELVKSPLWNLIHSVDAVPLYELYAKKFPEAVSKARAKSDYAWRNALEWVVAVHLLKGDTDKALAVVVENAKEDSTETWVNRKLAKKMQAEGKSAVLFDFYKKLLLKLPTADVWTSMIDLGARIHRSGEVSQLAQDLIAKQGAASAVARSSALDLLAATALAEDEVEQGLKHLRAKVVLARGEIEALLKKDKSERKEKWRKEFDRWGNELSSTGRQIQEVGKVTENEQVAGEGGEILSKWYKIRLANFGKDDYGYSSLMESLIEQGDLVLAEKNILERVKSATEKAVKSSEKENYPGSNPFRQGDFSELALSLIKLYDKAERYQDVVEMFESWPFWGVFDLSGLDHVDEEISFALVKALEKTGDQKKAVKVLQALLLKGELTGKDEAYATLLRLQGQGAMETLDQLYQRDAFEERPLIWKGVLLLEAGKLDQAEVLIRKAIAIDPSDGEQGKGDRMKVYGVLADILVAKGKKEDAKLYREVLKAIRLAEDADDVYAAGLVSRGIKQYLQALTHFSDAYCIQSRLAKQLNDAGRLDEARVHYRKAFELMPDSFGRMESHCFGCEGVFNGKNAEAIAEQVFTNLIKENPEKPQLYYLLGYLRASQDRDEEALELYQKAVKLDPDYINAWKKIIAYAERSFLTLQQGDQANLALSRLDPYGRHGGGNAGAVFDVRGMLAQLEAVEAAGGGEEVGDWFELSASKDLIEKLVDSQLSEAGEDFLKNGMTKQSLIKQMMAGGQVDTSSGARSSIRSFLQQHEVLNSWQQYYRVLLQQGD